MVTDLFSRIKPHYVFHLAARVAGIHANDIMSGEFIYENLMMQTNVIEAARINKVKKLLFCGSACIYPKECPQPIKEEYLLSAPLEKTNIGYALAKITGVIMCQMYRKQYGCNFINAMPTNLYGEGDNFSLNESHVIPAFINKFYDAVVNHKTTVEVWGTGIARREFLYVGDLVKALIFLINNYDDSQPINVGYGQDISIRELVDVIRNISLYNGNIIWNSTYPDGTIERRLDSSKINDLGWKAEVKFEDGIRKVYDWYVDNYKIVRR
jgi:GDP-L-fucose synthase